MSFLDVFKAPQANHEQIARAGEELILLLYNAPQTIKSLDDLRYQRYNKQITGKKLTSIKGVELKALPATCDAAKYHSYRAYYQVQQWLGNDVSPAEWGWERDPQSGNLRPLVKDKPAAPDKVLRLISCGCKQGCKKSCTCKNARLPCTALCSGCNGISCANCENAESDL